MICRLFGHARPHVTDLCIVVASTWINGELHEALSYQGAAIRCGRTRCNRGWLALSDKAREMDEQAERNGFKDREGAA